MPSEPVPGHDLPPARAELPWIGSTTDQHRILDAARALLLQGETLLAALSAETYGRRIPVAFHASIGGHYRHCLDHFTSVVGGWDSDRVDYDHRARNPLLERDPEAARRETAGLRMDLEQLDAAALDLPIHVRCEVSYEAGDSPLTRSTLGRELVYAIAHGIHHFALIAVMARLQGVDLPEDFGVAPSTVAHLAATARR